MSNGERHYELLPLTTWQKIRQILTLVGAIIAAITGSTAVSKQGCQGPPNSPPATSPATPPPPSKPEDPPLPSKPDNPPEDAIVQIQFGNAGCSASAIWPPNPDGRVQFMTAAHCLIGQPKEGIAILRDGRRIRVISQGRWDTPDIGWLVSELPVAKVPMVILATKIPPVGTKVFHVGFGIDKPGNREEGTVQSGENARGQIEFDISVSSGDSGGGICFTAAGEVLSPVCCTTNPSGRGRVWGASPLQAQKVRPLPVPVLDEWTPIAIPVIMP